MIMQIEPLAEITCWSGNGSQGDMRNEKRVVTSFMMSEFIDFVGV